MEGDKVDEIEFLNKCLQFALTNCDSDDRYAYLKTEQTASLELKDYYSLKIIRESLSKKLTMKRRNSYLDYNTVENITAIGLSTDREPEPVEVYSHEGRHMINLDGYDAIDVIVMLASDNPSLLTVELQEYVPTGRSRRSSRVVSRVLQDDEEDY